MRVTWCRAVQFNSDPDPGAADESLLVLDEVWDEQGPFEAIIGFSQGGAFTTVYLAHRQQTYGEHGFQRAVITAGFLLEDNEGIMEDKVIPESPYNDIPSFHWIGKYDSGITAPSENYKVTRYYTDPVVAVDPDGSHRVPRAGSARFDDLVAFLKGEEVCLDDPLSQGEVGSQDCSVVVGRPELCSRDLDGRPVSEICPKSCGVCG